MSADRETTRVCELLVDAEELPALEATRRFLRADDTFGNFAVDGFEVFVTRNAVPTPDPEADRDRWVTWPTLIEVLASTDTTHDREVAFVGDLMTHLRSAGHRVVAACAFEDELPQTDIR